MRGQMEPRGSTAMRVLLAAAWLVALAVNIYALVFAVLVAWSW